MQLDQYFSDISPQSRELKVLESNDERIRFSVLGVMVTIDHLGYMITYSWYENQDNELYINLIRKLPQIQKDFINKY